jgi:nucleoside-diphosphate-sugar epimerase
MVKLDKSKPLLVTGGTGYIASWIVKYLLDDGYTVHTTVRDKEKSDKYAHLLESEQKSRGTLKIFEADLLKSGSFDEAVQGCGVVMHTASPFFLNNISDPEKELIEPALKGTRNVLDSVNKAVDVKRVVLTSSIAAICGDNEDINITPNGIFTEENWNISSSVKHQPYSYSKTVAEEEAWKISKLQNRWDLVTINPGFVLGPSLTPRSDSTSIRFMIDMGIGTFKDGVPALYNAIADVRDIARAHIAASFNKSAIGRNIVVGATASLLRISKILRKRFGDKYPFPKRKVPKFLFWFVGPKFGVPRDFIKRNVGVFVRFDNSFSIKNLGIKYTPIKQTIIDHFHQLISDGLVVAKK